jgi:hypothetical protein
MATARVIAPTLALAAVTLAAGHAHAYAIRVSVDCLDPLSTSTKKGGSATLKSEGGDGQFPPDMLKAWQGVIQVRLLAGPVTGFSVTRRVLTDAEAFGAGRPNGYSGLAYPGPHSGLMWPYRDFVDLADGNAATTGDTVGSVVNRGDGRFEIGVPNPLAPNGLAPLSGEALGGPTETRTGFPMSPQWLNRGLPGNGARPLDASGNAFASVFGLDFNYADGLPRTIELTFLPGSTGDLVVFDPGAGVYREVQGVPIDTTPFRFTVPAPGTAGVLAIAGVLGMRRRSPAA